MKTTFSYQPVTVTPPAITVEIPEGYELVSGEPRGPVLGEAYIYWHHKTDTWDTLDEGNGGSKWIHWNGAEHPTLGNKAFIVRKKFIPQPLETILVRERETDPWVHRVFLRFDNQGHPITFFGVENVSSVSAEETYQLVYWSFYKSM